MDESMSPADDVPESTEALTLLEKIAANPYEYDNHITYIRLLRRSGNGEDLRQAREVFHSFFPLSEELWLQWLDDEEEAANTDDSLNTILALYDLAVADYLSLNIWCRYLNFIENNAYSLAAGLGTEIPQFLDMCYKKAIAATQYHIPESQRIWIRERDRRLKSLTASQISVVNKMYLERLKIPHAQMEETFSEFSAFVTKYLNDEYEQIMSSASKEYGKAIRTLRERELFELQLQQSNGSLPVFSAYLDSERSSKSSLPRLTQTLFERALVIYWQQPSIWEDYAYFAIQKKFDDSEIVSILERATRNCPWSGDLWAFYIRFLAQVDNYPFANLITVKEKAIAVPWLSSQPAELAKLWCVWLSLCRLAVGDWDPQSDEVEFLESELSECLEAVGKNFATPHEYLAGRLMIYLKTQLNDEEQARDIWNVMSKANGSSCNYWLDRIAWERGQGQLRICHEMFKRNLTKILDDPVRFCSEYLLFLNQEGLLPELNAGYAAVHRVSGRFVKEGTQVPNPVVDKAGDAATESLPVPDNKRKLSVNSETTPAKKPKIDHENGLQRDREHATILATNFPIDTNEDQLRHFFRECGVIRRLNEKSDGTQGKSFIVEFEKESDAASALTKNMKLFKGQEISVEQYSQSVLWVTNYPAAYDESDLRTLFSEFGSVVDIRLPSLAINTKRRFAYIEFDSPNDAASALAADGMKLDDEHSLVVKLSDPENRTSRANPAADGRELFIVNIDFDSSEADVRALLSQYGEIQSLRLLSKPGEKHHSGRAFVVYHSKNAADNAMTLNGTRFMTRDLKVQKSDPDRATHLRQPRDSRVSATAKATSALGTEPPLRIPGKAIGVIGIPDTVNEARIRSLVSSSLSLEKVEMRPENEGAILVFETEVDAGKAAMELGGAEVSGSVLRTVSVRQLKQHHTSNPVITAAPALAFTPSSVRFGAKKKRGGGR